jgi:hypothetical protein
VFHVNNRLGLVADFSGRRDSNPRPLRRSRLSTLIKSCRSERKAEKISKLCSTSPTGLLCSCPLLCNRHRSKPCALSCSKSVDASV